ncbi:hypothetical protein KAH94_00740 [bacterium]|nr:hypothetical protein [bacterium]
MNNIKTNKNGSILLLMILILSTITFLCLHMYKNYSLTLELVIKRQKKEQLSHMTCGALNYGILFCKKHFKKILTKQKDILLDGGTWNIQGLPEYQANITIKPKKTTVDVRALLVKKETGIAGFVCACTLECKQTEKNNNYFVVNNWEQGIE